jgi:hypothetical protein
MARAFAHDRCLSQDVRTELAAQAGEAGLSGSMFVGSARTLMWVLAGSALLGAVWIWNKAGLELPAGKPKPARGADYEKSFAAFMERGDR